MRIKTDLAIQSEFKGKEVLYVDCDFLGGDFSEVHFTDGSSVRFMNEAAEWNDGRTEEADGFAIVPKRTRDSDIDDASKLGAQRVNGFVGGLHRTELGAETRLFYLCGGSPRLMSKYRVAKVKVECDGDDCIYCKDPWKY